MKSEFKEVLINKMRIKKFKEYVLYYGVKAFFISFASLFEYFSPTAILI